MQAWENPKIYLDMYSGDKFVTQIYNIAVYDDSLWSYLERNFEIFSWLPFFSSCNNYDRRIELFDIFEDDQSCK